MPRPLKTVTPTRRGETTFTVQVDPLTVARGHRTLPRGGVHATARRPNRSAGKRRWRREQGVDAG